MKYLLFLTSLFLAAGCTRDKVAPPDTELPVITLITPANNQVVTGGQNLPIKASISDNIKLKEVHLEIVNTTTNTFLQHEHFVPDSAIYFLDRSFTPLSSTRYKITVEAVDTHDNEARTEVAITAN